MEAPARIGPYRIVEPLGKGGMGVVWRAVHEARGDVVALKTVRVPQERQLGGIRREIGAVARIRHPGIVRVVDHGVDQGLPWYAMELLDDVSLRQWASRATLREALAVVRQVCVPLAFLHGAGIVHRDLKPGNVLVRADGMPVLVDFGVVARFAAASGREALEASSSLMGTVSYMAPEQILGDPVDARADLYALGCILYELATGEKPFTGSMQTVLYKHVHEAPPVPSERARGLPPGFDELVARLLAKDPKQRIGYASDVATAIEQVLGAPIQPMDAPRARPYLYRPGLAGRQGASKALRDRLGPLRRGGGMLLIGGETGIGKTRLLVELGAEAAQNDAKVFASAVGSEAAPLHALRPLLQAVLDRCQALGALGGRELLGEHGPVLALYEPGLAAFTKGDVPDVPPEVAVRRLARSLETVLAAIGEDRGVVTLLDDLHLADPLSIEVLAEMARGKRLRMLPLLVVGTYKAEQAEGLGALLDAAPRIHLDRLKPADVGAMVADMLALPSPPPLFVEFLARHSEGNPLFVAEYLRACVDEGLLWRDRSGSWQVGEPDDQDADLSDYDRLPVPRTLKALLKQRLGPLSPEANAVAAAVAAVGREAPTAILAPMTRLDDDKVAEALVELARRGVLEERGENVRFAHGHMRALVYDPLRDDQKKRLHRRAARELEARYPERRAELLAELATHWERAGEADLAKQRWFAAARRAIERSAYADAERAFRAAFALADPLDDDTIGERITFAHRVLDVLGKDDEALAEQRRAVADARAGGFAAMEARAVLGLGRLHHIHGRAREAESHHRQALELARAAGDVLVVGGALNNLALLARDEGRLGEARQLFEEDLAICRSRGDVGGEGTTLGNLALVARDQGRLDEAWDLEERSIAICREVGDRWGEATTLGNHGELALELGRGPEARQLFEAALALHRETGSRLPHLLVLLGLAALERRSGRPDLAAGWLEEADRVFPECGFPPAGVALACAHGFLALAKGEEAGPWLAEAGDCFHRSGAAEQSEAARHLARLKRAMASRSRIAGEAAEDAPKAFVPG